MPPRPELAVCPKCACHAKVTETQCPVCGAALRSQIGLSVPAAVLAMGLTAVACSGGGGGTTTTASGAGGAGGMTSASSGGGKGGAGGVTSSSVSQSAVTGYTVAASTSTSATGTGGQSGTGGADAGP